MTDFIYLAHPNLPPQAGEGATTCACVGLLLPTRQNRELLWNDPVSPRNSATFRSSRPIACSYCSGHDSRARATHSLVEFSGGVRAGVFPL